MIRFLLIAACFFGNYYIAAQTIEKLPISINTKQFDEVAPVFDEADNILYFSRIGYPETEKTLIQNGIDLSKQLSDIEYENKLKEIYSDLAGSPITSPYTSAYNQDIWLAIFDSTELVSIAHPTDPINNALPNTVLSYWSNANELILLNQFLEDGGMEDGLSRLNLKRLGERPKPMEIDDFYTLGSDVQASIADDGEYIILALEREDTEGDMDLYISHRLSENRWSAPQHLGQTLNSEYRESTPFISRDQKRLFFASNRPESMGGLDIFVSQRLSEDWSQWSTPTRLPDPINSTMDDSQPCFTRNGALLFFSSNRDGSSDLFRVSLNIDALDPKTQKSEPPNIANTPIKTNGLELVISLIDQSSKKAISGNIRYRSLALQSENKALEVPASGRTLILDQPTQYSFYIKLPGYQNAEFLFDAQTLIRKNVASAKLDIPLKSIRPQQIYATDLKEKSTEEKPKKVKKYASYKTKFLKAGEQISETYVLDNILFKPGTNIVTENSYAALRKLSAKVKSSPNSRIVIEGHTSIGDEVSSVEEQRKKNQQLQKLSELRAKAIKLYLTKEGIDPKRIEAIGYGSKHPLNNNSNEIEKQLNRRVEITLIQ